MKAAPEARGPRRNFSFELFSIAALALGLMSAWVAWADSAPQAGELRERRDGPRPSFILTDIKGQRHVLTEYRGRAVLVHFFATWCETCRPEMRALERLVTREPDAAFQVIALSVKESASRVRRFLETTPVTFPILLDSAGDVAKAWGVDVLPTTYVLDTDLKPHLFADRDVDWDRIDLANILGAIKSRSRDSLNHQHR